MTRELKGQAEDNLWRQQRGEMWYQWDVQLLLLWGCLLEAVSQRRRKAQRQGHASSGPTQSKSFVKKV